MQHKFTFHFDWDPLKAAANYKKHQIEFETATTVFNDPRAISVCGERHSAHEERWSILGHTASADAVVVVYRLVEWAEQEARIRVISARRATATERQQYAAATHSIQEPNAKPEECDFTSGVRGKLYRAEAAYEVPIYIDPEVLAFFTALARSQKTPASELMNQALTREMVRQKAQR